MAPSSLLRECTLDLEGLAEEMERAGWRSFQAYCKEGFVRTSIMRVFVA
jgi:hypothetical protein